MVTPPLTLPLSVGEAKAHLHVDHVNDDGYIQDCINAAIGELDAPKGWLGRSLMTRTMRLTLDGYPPALVYLPGPVTTAISTIHVRNSEDEIVELYNAEDEVDELGLQYDLTAEPALIWPSDSIGWPTDIKGGIDSVRIEYVTGYATAAAVPKAFVQWLKIRTGDFYRDRESTILGVSPARNHVADRLLDNWRVYE